MRNKRESPWQAWNPFVVPVTAPRNRRERAKTLKHVDTPERLKERLQEKAVRQSSEQRLGRPPSNTGLCKKKPHLQLYKNRRGHLVRPFQLQKKFQKLEIRFCKDLKEFSFSSNEKSL